MADIKVYGAMWCSDCLRSKRFLEANGIAFDWVDIEKDPEAADFVVKTCGDARTVPVVVFPDGSCLVEPGDEELGRKLGLV